MTLISALKMGARIVVMSDTAVSNRDAVRPNIIPGRLKSIILSTRMTVSYAGLSAPALDAIRYLHRNKVDDDEEAIAYLLSTCERFAGEIDFIFCSHHKSGGSRLAKITSGGKSEGSTTYWIGSANAARTLSTLDVQVPHLEDAPDYQPQEERLFTRRFFEYLEKHADSNVGGVAVNCLCSSCGHCYQDHAGAALLKPIQIPDLVPPEVRLAEERTGMSRFAYHLYSAEDRGVAVVGYYLEQAKVGYLHIPLEHDDALKVEAEDQAEFRRIVSAAGKARSGA
jgi:hypothetical protein